MFSAMVWKWAAAPLPKDTGRHQPSPLTDPIAPPVFPGDCRRLAPSNYIPGGRSIPSEVPGCCSTSGSAPSLTGPRRARFRINGKIGSRRKVLMVWRRGAWAAMILEPRGELKRCQAASNKTYLSITGDFLLHRSTYRESHRVLMDDFNVHV